MKFLFKIEIGMESIYKNRTNRLPIFDRFDSREKFKYLAINRYSRYYSLKKKNDLIRIKINIDLLISIHSRFIIHYSNQRCIENVYREEDLKYKRNDLYRLSWETDLQNVIICCLIDQKLLVEYIFSYFIPWKRNINWYWHQKKKTFSDIYNNQNKKK